MYSLIGLVVGFRRLSKILPLAFVTLTLGVPISLDRRFEGCHRSIDSLSLTVEAIGIETSGNWALITMNGQESILVNEGDTLGACFSLSRVTNNSVVVGTADSAQQRQFFFGGVASRQISKKPRLAVSQDGFLRAFEGHHVTLSLRLSTRLNIHPSQIVTLYHR